MIEGALLPEQPGADVDAETWAFHHRLLYRLVLGTAGTTTEDLQLCYDVVAPVAYQGTTASPSDSRRWRRKLLGDLVDAGLIAQHPSPRGRLWVPVDPPEALLARVPTEEASVASAPAQIGNCAGATDND